VFYHLKVWRLSGEWTDSGNEACGQANRNACFPILSGVVT